MIAEYDDYKNYTKNDIRVDITSIESLYIKLVNEISDDENNNYKITVTIEGCPNDEIRGFINTVVDRFEIGRDSRIIAYLTPRAENNVVLILCTHAIYKDLFIKRYAIEAPISHRTAKISFSN